jgi:stearoyl-CoA desaturase (delta-9 desaturase)
MAALSFAAFALTYYALAGLGVNLAYHRVLSHRSLRLPLWLERTLVTIGLPAGTPLQWAGNHRYHHATADTPLDPHSPFHRGFLYAHVGWYFRSSNPGLCVAYALGGPVRMLVDAWMRPRTNQEHNALAADVAADSWYRFISRPWPYAVAMHLHTAIPLAIAYLSWGAAGVFGFWLTLVTLYNLADGIDSVSHVFGHKLEQQRDESRNLAWMGVFVLGEGWHANHHRFPYSARHGLVPGQFDWTWQVIRGLRALGLATHVRVPTRQDLVAERLIQE